VQFGGHGRLLWARLLKQTARSLLGAPWEVQRIYKIEIVPFYSRYETKDEDIFLPQFRGTLAWLEGVSIGFQVAGGVFYSLIPASR